MTTPSTNKNKYHYFIWKRARVLLWSVALCATFSGCAMGLKFDEFNKYMTSSPTHPDEGNAHLADASSPTSSLSGPDWLPDILRRKKDEAPRYRQNASSAATARFKQAEALFQKKEYKHAEKEFKHIAKRYNNTSIEEDAMFMVAESQFMQKRYSWAQDSYDALFDEFPSTRHLSKSTERLFTIARTWLNSSDVITSNDVDQVNYIDPKETASIQQKKKSRFDVTRIIPILPNLTDRSRPYFDTDGRAMQALKSIWMNDPTGKMADDALMLAASNHLRNGEYMEASRLYKIIRQEYPKSSHLEDAMILASHSEGRVYQGSLYDQKPLLEAEKLKLSSLNIFRDGKNRPRLQKELAKIAEAKAAHQWQDVVYWEKKGRPKSVAIYCQIVMDEHPDSKYAEMARKKLSALRQQPKRKEWAFPQLRPVKFPNLIPVPKKDKEDKQPEEKPARLRIPVDE